MYDGIRWHPPPSLIPGHRFGYCLRGLKDRVESRFGPPLPLPLQWDHKSLTYLKVRHILRRFNRLFSLFTIHQSHFSGGSMVSLQESDDRKPLYQQSADGVAFLYSLTTFLSFWWKISPNKQRWDVERNSNHDRLCLLLLTGPYISLNGSIFRLISKTEKAAMEYLSLNAQLMIWHVIQKQYTILII